jgi:hypothetical protein
MLEAKEELQLPDLTVVEPVDPEDVVGLPAVAAVEHQIYGLEEQRCLTALLLAPAAAAVAAVKEALHLEMAVPVAVPLAEMAVELKETQATVKVDKEEPNLRVVHLVATQVAVIVVPQESPDLAEMEPTLIATVVVLAAPGTSVVVAEVTGPVPAAAAEVLPTPGVSWEEIPKAAKGPEMDKLLLAGKTISYEKCNSIDLAVYEFGFDATSSGSHIRHLYQPKSG